jgi:O-methyltransferase
MLFPILVSIPAHVAFIARGSSSRKCGYFERLKIAGSAAYIHLRINCGHNPAELLQVIEEIVELDSAVPGILVECGAYLGGSTAKLSLAARFANRRLIVCDSFEGLPEVNILDLNSTKQDFQQGAYHGTLSVVKDNVRRFGRQEWVDYLPGWFDQTLGTLKDYPVVTAFWDVDLQASFRSCLLGLWKQVIPGSKVFIHDVDRDSVVEVFTDNSWWQENLGEPPPMLEGAYMGINRSSPLLGYLVKHQTADVIKSSFPVGEELLE